MPVRNLKGFPVFVWVPPTSSAAYKLTVERSDGTIDDLSQIAHMIEIEDGVTENIGRFSFEVWNPNETYTNVWAGNEIVRYYSDYAADATTLRFRGRIEKPSQKGNKLYVTGRADALKVVDRVVTKTYSATETSVILLDLISTYATGFTSTNVATSSVTVTKQWTEKPFWDCVKELCADAGFDCYVDKNLDFNYFEQGSRLNTGEAIVHDYNLLEIGDFSPDLTLLRNKVKVYGATIDGIQIIYTANDLTSQGTYGIKEEIITDTNITEYTQAAEVGEAKLTILKNPPIVGEIKSILMATVQPGEQIRLSSPEDNIIPSFYQSSSYKHRIDEGLLSTTIKIVKDPVKISQILKSIITSANESQETSSNPFQMEFTYNFLYNTDEGTHSNTEITGGVLKLQSGQTSGSWTSPTRIETGNIIQAYLVVVGQTLTGATYEVSADGGINYQDIENGELVTLSTSVGENLIVRVTFSDATTQIDSLSLQYLK